MALTKIENSPQERTSAGGDRTDGKIPCSLVLRGILTVGKGSYYLKFEFNQCG